MRYAYTVSRRRDRFLSRSSASIVFLAWCARIECLRTRERVPCCPVAVSDVVDHTVPEAHNVDWFLQEDGPKALKNEKLTTSPKTITH